MRQFLLSIVLAVSLAGFVKAQETIRKSAEKNPEVENELLKYENDLVQAILKGGSFAADFFDRNDADDQDLVSDGKVSTKAKHVAAWRDGKMKVLSSKHHDYRVRVYGNGSAAVVTFEGTNQWDRHGEISESSYRDTDVFVKEDGIWLRVVHHVFPVQMK